MAVMAREAWTDERLDDLVKRIDQGFREQREETRALRAEMNTRFEAVDARFERMEARMDAKFDALNARFDARFDALNARFEAMQRLMISALLIVVLGFIVDKVV
jgi:hypothetical protein